MRRWRTNEGVKFRTTRRHPWSSLVRGFWGGDSFWFILELSLDFRGESFAVEESDSCDVLTVAGILATHHCLMASKGNMKWEIKFNNEFFLYSFSVNENLYRAMIMPCRCMTRRCMARRRFRPTYSALSERQFCMETFFRSSISPHSTRN